MEKYRFKKGAGRHIGIVDGKAKRLQPGDVVELTENQAAKFRDKFEPADATSGPAKQSAAELRIALKEAEEREAAEAAADAERKKAEALEKAKAAEAAAEEAQAAQQNSANKGNAKKD